MEPRRLAQLVFAAHSEADKSRRLEAAQALEKLHGQPGFCLALLRDVGGRAEVDNLLRQSALIYAKNFIRRRWSGPTRGSSHDGCLDAGEKQAIRQFLLDFLCAGQPAPLGAEATLMIGLICKTDYPGRWPNVVERLVHMVKSPPQGSLRVVHAALKSLRAIAASVSCVAAKAALHQAADDLLLAVAPTWSRATGAAVAGLRALLQPDAAAETRAQLLPPLAVACEANKLLRTLVTNELVPVDGRSLHAWLSKSCDMLTALHELGADRLAAGVRSGSAAAEWARQLLQRLLKKLAKNALLMLDQHAEAFRPHVAGYLSRFYRWISSVPPAVCPQYTVCALTFLHASLNEARAAQLLPAGVVAKLARLLIERYLPLSGDDLRLWKEAPEEFVQLELHGWQDSPRVCAQILLSGLCQAYDEQLAPLVRRVFAQLPQLPETRSPDFLALAVRRDAGYAALALAASPTLLDLLPLDVLIAMFVAEVQRNDAPELAIVHRRITVVIDEWFRASSMARRCTAAQTAAIFQLLTGLLRRRDLCVRVFAAIALRGCVDQYEFDYRQLLPFVPSVVASIASLVFQLQHDTIHVHMLSILSLIVTNLNELVAPHVFTVVDCLERLWRESGDNYLLKSNVIQCLTTLARTPSLHSDRLAAVLVAVVDQCVDVSVPATGYYLEDAVELWLELLNCPSSLHMTKPLLHCWRHAPPLLRDSFDHIGPVARITASYLAIDAAAFHARYGTAPVKLCLSIVDDIGAKAARLLLVILHAYVQRAEPSVLHGVFPLIRRLLSFNDDDDDTARTAKLVRDVEILVARLLLRHGSPGLSAFFAATDIDQARCLVFVGHWLAHLAAPSTEETDRVLLWLALARCLDTDVVMASIGSPAALAEFITKLLHALLTVAPDLDSQHHEEDEGRLHSLLVVPVLTTDRQAFLRARLRAFLKDQRWTSDQLYRCCPQALQHRLDAVMQSSD